MQIGLARIRHRSNSFALSATTLDDFQASELLTGDAFQACYEHTGTEPGGVFQCSDSTGATIVPLLATSALAGGPVMPDAIDGLARLVLEQVTSPPEQLDGLILNLSGAMTTTDARSGDELLLRRIRESFPELPIAVIFDHCANLTDGIIDSVELIESAGLVPQQDQCETGQRTLKSLVALVQNGTRPQMQIERLPLITPLPAQRATSAPFDAVNQTIDELRQQPDVISASLFAGYPYTDAPHAGASIVVAATDNRKEQINEIAQQLWSRRREIYVEGSNVEEAVHFAMANREGMVLISDLGDNPDDGAPGDGTTVLWALMDLGVRNATVGAIVDEQAVDACFRAGEDSRVEIPVGGRRDTRHGYPIDIRAKVVTLREGSLTLNGPLNHGRQIDPGRTVVLDVEARHEGHVELILTEKPVQITDTSIFEQLGIDLSERAIVSIKSANDYLPAFAPLTSRIFEVITPGITTPDPAFFAFQQITRPIYPLDEFEG